MNRPTSNEPVFIRIRYRLLSSSHIQFNRTESFQVEQNTPYYDVITQMYNIVKPSIEYECESIELYSETGYPLVTNPAYFLGPIKLWLLRNEELVYAIPKAILPPPTAPVESTNPTTKHMIIVQSINDDLVLGIEALSFDDDTVLGSEIKRALALHIKLPPFCISLYQRPINYRSPSRLEEDKGVSVKAIQENRIELIFELSEEYWTPTSLDAFASGLARPCGLQHPEYNVLHTFNSELMYFSRELSGKSKDELLQFLGSLRKNTCSAPMVYAMYLLATGNSISLPHKIAILEGISMILSFAVDNKHSIPDKLPLFSQLCAFIEKSSNPGDKITEQYDNLYLPSRSRRKSPESNIRRLAMSFPEEQKEMVLWSSAPRVNQKLNAKIALDKNDSFPYKNSIELMFDFMQYRVENGLLLSHKTDSNGAVVFTGGSKEAYKYLKYYSPKEGKAVSFHPHDFPTIPMNIGKAVSNSNTTGSMILLLDFSQELGRTDINSIQGKQKTEKYGCTQLSTGLILINTIIDRLIRQETNHLLGLYVFSRERQGEEFNRLLVSPTLCYNDILLAVDTTLQVLMKPSITKQQKVDEDPLANAIVFCSTNYPKSSLVCITNQNTAKDIKNCIIPFDMKSLVVFGGQFSLSREEKTKIKMLINENTVDRHITNEQNIFDEYPFSNSRLVEYIDLVENHIRIENKNESEMESPAINEFQDHDDQLENLQQNFTSASTPDDVVHILRVITQYVRNPNPYAKMYSTNRSLKDWFITFEFHKVIPNVELLMHFPSRYPLAPPKFRILCKIRHCNVDKKGNICHPLLFDGYKNSISLRKIIDAIYNLFVSPIPSHAVQTKELLLFYAKNKENKTPIFSSSLISRKLNRSQSARTAKDIRPKCPDYLICPLTHKIFENPVITPDGNTFDREALLLYINCNHKEPISNKPLNESDLTPNKAIADEVAKQKRSVKTEKYWWEKI